MVWTLDLLEKPGAARQSSGSGRRTGEPSGGLPSCLGLQGPASLPPSGLLLHLPLSMDQYPLLLNAWAGASCPVHGPSAWAIRRASLSTIQIPGNRSA